MRKFINCLNWWYVKVSMTIQMIWRILRIGDKYGSAFKELAEHYNIQDYDLSLITDEMAENWINGRNDCDSRNNTSN